MDQKSAPQTLVKKLKHYYAKQRNQQQIFTEWKDKKETNIKNEWKLEGYSPKRREQNGSGL